MHKRYLLTKLYEFGDAIINMKTGEAFLATADFSLPYIRKGRHKREHVADLFGKVILFNFTDNKYMCIEASKVQYLTPLSKILNNPSRDIM